MQKQFSGDNKQQVPTVSQSTPKVSHKTSSVSLDRSESSQGSNKLLSWMTSSKRASIESQEDSDPSTDTVQWKLNINEEKLYERSVSNLFDFGLRQSSPISLASPEEPLSPPESQKVKAESLKANEKTKVPTSVLPWKTKWKPSPEDLKNWNRFLSTNSEEMSKSMQFSFNDLKLRGFAGHTGAVRGFAVNEPSKVFASASRDKTVKIWSLNVHQDIEQWQIDPYSESKVTYTGHRKGLSHDIHFLSSTQDMVASCDGNLHLWNPETGAGLHQFSSSRSFLASVRPIFNSRHLIGGTVDGHLTFYDVHHHTAMQTWKSNMAMTGLIRVIAVNPSDRLIAVAFSTGTISLIESRTGTLVASWKGAESEITSLKFYTDDILLSCAPADHVLYCWNTSRLALVKTIPTPQDITSFDIYKDEIITINSNNSVSFIPINDDFQAYSSKFKPSILKSQVSAFGIVTTDQLLLFGCTEGEIFLYA
ncbi:WD40-repeat-containing domain protein [Sporodiniella umbellata]|nr:WD40-repeat-containing domain protein [Sporodiniella umbellata]